MLQCSIVLFDAACELFPGNTDLRFQSRYDAAAAMKQAAGAGLSSGSCATGRRRWVVVQEAVVWSVWQGLV